MGKQETEMLKGTLEGIVLAILSGRPAYGYEITAWLRDQGFSDIAEGTVYALLIRIEQRGLVDVQKVPSEKGPPRKVYSLNAQGREALEDFWRTWSFLAERIEQLRGQAEDGSPGSRLLNVNLEKLIIFSWYIKKPKIQMNGEHVAERRDQGWTGRN